MLLYSPSKMELDFQSTFPEFSSYEEVYEHLLEKTFQHLHLTFDPIVSVSLVDNTFIHQMNKEYRHIDRPTDVISFAFLDDDPERDTILKSPEPVCLGDIYISVDKAKQQAIDYGHSINRELKFLFVHGLLHLLGYDHMQPEDEKVMFQLQDEILQNEGD